MIVGKKYFVKKEDYNNFCRKARNFFISEKFIESFNREKSHTLLSCSVDFIMFNNDRITWHFSEGMKYFNLYIKHKQEEMPI